MDTKQLETFVVLSEEKNYSRASIRLNYSPATLFEHMRSLENELCVKLTARVGNATALTEQGKAFLPYAQKILSLKKEAVNQVQSSKEKEVLRVATAESLGHYRLMKPLRDFAAAHDDCQMQVRVGNCAEFTQLLMNDQIDVAFIYGNEVINTPTLLSVPLFEEKIRIVASPLHVLASKESVAPEDLSGQRFAFTYGNCCYTIAFLKQLDAHCVQLAQKDYLGNVEMIKRCALDNYSLALMTTGATETECKAGKLVSLNWQGEPISVKAQMLCRRNPKLCSEQLVKWIRRFFVDAEE